MSKIFLNRELARKGSNLIIFPDFFFFFFFFFFFLILIFHPNSSKLASNVTTDLPDVKTSDLKSALLSELEVYDH